MGAKSPIQERSDQTPSGGARIWARNALKFYFQNLLQDNFYVTEYMKGKGPKGPKFGPLMCRRHISCLQGLAKLARSANLFAS